jgi:hypothetical protein
MLLQAIIPTGGRIFSTTGSLVFGATCTLVFCSTIFIGAFLYSSADHPLQSYVGRA